MGPGPKPQYLDLTNLDHINPEKLKSIFKKKKQSQFCKSFILELQRVDHKKINRTDQLID